MATGRRELRVRPKPRVRRRRGAVDAFAVAGRDRVARPIEALFDGLGDAEVDGDGSRALVAGRDERHTMSERPARESLALSGGRRRE